MVLAVDQFALVEGGENPQHASLEKLKNDFSIACASIYPQNGSGYECDYVLLLYWEGVDLSTREALNNIEALFGEEFGYNVGMWEIPTYLSEHKLNQKLCSLMRYYDSDDDLFIVYYGGHAETNLDGENIWRPYVFFSLLLNPLSALNESFIVLTVASCKKSDSASINWTSVQFSLLRAPCDVLILLDPYYAGAGRNDHIEGTNELLAACGRGHGTSGVCDHSFTTDLVRMIQSFGRQPFTIIDLYMRLINDQAKLRRTRYHPISSRDGRRLTLKPLPFVMANTDSSTASSTSQPSSALPISSSGIPRVLLAVSLRSDAGTSTLESLIHWLSTETPWDNHKIEIKTESAYESSSLLVLLKMPGNVWTLLPNTSTYRFVGFVRSENGLQLSSASPSTASSLAQPSSTNPSASSDDTRALLAISLHSDAGTIAQSAYESNSVLAIVSMPVYI